MSTPAPGAGDTPRPEGRAATRALAAHPDIQQIKRQAKELLKGFLAGDSSAIDEVRTHYRAADPQTFALADAQLALARAYGQASWPKLMARLGAAGGDAEVPSARLKPAFRMPGRPWRRESVVVDGTDAWALFCACADGDEARVRHLVAADPDLLHAQIWYGKPLDTAIRQNHVDVVRYLLERDARGWLWDHVYVDRHNIPRRDVRHRGWDELDRVLLDYQLHRAPQFSPAFASLAGHIEARDLNLARRALRNGELLHASDLAGNTALHHAVRVNAFDIVEHLVEAGPDVNAVNARGATPLDLSLHEAQLTSYLLAQGAQWTLAAAARTGHLEQVRSILNEDPAAAQRLDAEQRSPLTHAVRGDHLRIVQVLLDNGADPNAPERGAPYGAALYTACVLDRRAIADLLLAHGANPDATMDSSGPAIAHTKQNIKRVLRAAGALEHQPWGLDASGSHEAGWAQQQLHTALSDGHPVIRDDEDRQFAGGWGTFVHCVCEAGDAEILDRYVGTVGTERLHELTSRHCRHDHPGFIARLVHHGVDPDNRDWMGRTALHYAAEGNQVAAAAAWLQQGASIDAVDVRESTTPLGYAARRGHTEMVRFLLDQGAAPQPAVPGWAQPRALAELEGYGEVVEMLPQHGCARASG